MTQESLPLEERPATVLLIPSLGRGAEDFSEIVDGLKARGIKAVASEPPSASDVAKGDLGDLARWHFKEMKEVGIPVVVVGHAFGNWIARMCAVLFPQQVEGLVLLAAARREIAPQMRAEIDRCIDMARSAAERLESLRSAYFAPGSDASVWLDGWDPQLAHAQRQAVARSDRTLWWDGGGTVPILDVQAQEDRISAFERRNELRDELGVRVEVAVVENAGHALLPENPRAVAALVAQFVTVLARDRHENTDPA